MSKAKHTPGPWYLRTNRHPNTDGTKWGWLDANQAGDQRPPSGVNVTWSAGQTSEANARLIAAAPELLEAAQMVIAWYEAEDDHSKADFYERMQMCRDSESALRAAIAKATGEQA